MDVKVLGRTIGTASGWDQVDDEILFFYDFVPNAKVMLPSGDLQWDYLNGIIEVIRDVEESEVDFVPEGGLFDVIFGIVNDEGATQEVVYREDIVKVLRDVEMDDATGTV